ncbi:MAG: dephospho-CoA kinase [Ruminococcaceae bacterium]|nr:dephospho-CoA kinase [Oscillospiraceae bacterium]
MIIIGLTGQSGAGKGAASDIFLRYGIPAVDTDAVYHRILSDPQGPCTAELADAFGSEILNADGTVDRKKLAQAVFGKPDTPALLHILNTVTHKYIMAETRKMLHGYELSGKRAAIIDAPQLFEARAEEECDLVVAILAPRELRLARIMERDGISIEAATRRIDAQHSDAFFRERCHAVLENNGNLTMLEEQIRGFLIKFNLGLS